MATMDESALKAWLAKGRGMAFGGAVDDEDDAETDVTPYNVQMPYTPPQEPSPLPMDTPSPPGENSTDSVQSLDTPYDRAANSDALQQAIADKRHSDLIANVGKSLSQIATARAAANGYKADNGVFDAIRDQGAQDVQQAAAMRSQAVKDFLTKQQLGRQGVQDQYNANAEQRAQGEYDRTPVEKAKQREFLEKELALKLASKEEMHQDSVDQRRATQASTDEARKGREADAVTRKQGEAYTKARHDLETFRGNSAAQQANQDVLSSNKALQLVKGKDPNTLTTQDLSLLSSEMSKIATGGVPTEHGQQALMPSNLATKAAELQNFLTSNPTNAQAGEYVKKNMGYLEDMQQVAKDSVADYRRNLLKGYKHTLSPEDYSEAEKDYDLAPHNQARGAPTGSSSASAPGATPQPDVQAYAAKHSISYEQALSIKSSRMGGQ